MAASTIFYSITRGATDLTRKVIELDTAMVNLQRVMDLPEHKFNEMLEQSIDNVENLSGKLGDYLNLVAEFGRMGYSDIDTLDMSNTAQMLTNISDLTADESVSSLVAAMTAFNITAEESVNIADKLNEVDNQYSITTKDLAKSMNKSAS
ncbi:MAG TPA: phage tail tape measure protein, partial [Paenisporosarcina sp.]|nr:phage tail tape measure protein [Paenisporosarcina sp.]